MYNCVCQYINDAIKTHANQLFCKKDSIIQKQRKDYQYSKTRNRFK